MGRCPRVAKAALEQSVRSLLAPEHDSGCQAHSRAAGGLDRIAESCRTCTTGNRGTCGRRLVSAPCWLEATRSYLGSYSAQGLPVEIVGSPTLRLAARKLDLEGAGGARRPLRPTKSPSHRSAGSKRQVDGSYVQARGPARSWSRSCIVRRMELRAGKCPVCLVGVLEVWEVACSDCGRAKYATFDHDRKSELVRAYEVVCCVVSGVRALHRPCRCGASGPCAGGGREKLAV